MYIAAEILEESAEWQVWLSPLVDLGTTRTLTVYHKLSKNPVRSATHVYTVKSPGVFTPYIPRPFLDAVSARLKEQILSDIAKEQLVATLALETKRKTAELPPIEEYILHLTPHDAIDLEYVLRRAVESAKCSSRVDSIYTLLQGIDRV